MSPRRPGRRWPDGNGLPPVPVPVRDLRDAGFLEWSNLRVVVSLGLFAGLAAGLAHAVWGGLSAVNVTHMVLIAAAVPVVMVTVHLYLRRTAGDGR